MQWLQTTNSLRTAWRPKEVSLQRDIYLRSLRHHKGLIRGSFLRFSTVDSEVFALIILPLSTNSFEIFVWLELLSRRGWKDYQKRKAIDYILQMIISLAILIISIHKYCKPFEPSFGLKSERLGKETNKQKIKSHISKRFNWN